MSLVNVFDLSIPLFSLISVYIGINETDIDVNHPNNIVGIAIAIKYASIIKEVPKKYARTISLPNPNSLHINDMNVIIIAVFFIDDIYTHLNIFIFTKIIQIKNPTQYRYQ